MGWAQVCVYIPVRVLSREAWNSAWNYSIAYFKPFHILIQKNFALNELYGLVFSSACSLTQASASNCVMYSFSVFIESTLFFKFFANCFGHLLESSSVETEYSVYLYRLKLRWDCTYTANVIPPKLATYILSKCTGKISDNVVRNIYERGCAATFACCATVSYCGKIVLLHQW